MDGPTDRVLGVHMVGPDSPEIVQLAAVCIKVRDLAGCESALLLNNSNGCFIRGIYINVTPVFRFGKVSRTI